MDHPRRSQRQAAYRAREVLQSTTKSRRTKPAVAAVVEAKPVTPFVASPAQKRILNKRARQSLSKASKDLGVAAAAVPSTSLHSPRRSSHHSSHSSHRSPHRSGSHHHHHRRSHGHSHRRNAYTPRRRQALRELPYFRKSVGRAYIVEGKASHSARLRQDVDRIRREANKHLQGVRMSRDRKIENARHRHKTAWKSYRSGKSKHVKSNERAYRALKQLRYRK